MKKMLFRLLVVWGVLFAAQTADGTEETNVDRDLRPLLTTSELLVGTNRLAFGLMKGGRLIEGAAVQLAIYSMEGTRAHLVGRTDAPYRGLGAPVDASRVHRHADGTRHVHGSGSDVRGLYIARVSFDRPGLWGIEISARQDKGSPASSRIAVMVHQAPQTPAVGSPAPRSRNLIADDVTDLREIDTSAKPDPRLHRMRIADAIAQKTPQLIVFATPQFCTSRMCGPVVDVVRSLLSTWGKRVAFIHQEIWQDFAGKKMFQTVEEWRLETEPWVFVVDGSGTIRAKFEGLVTARELDAALQQLLQEPAGRTR